MTRLLALILASSACLPAAVVINGGGNSVQEDTAWEAAKDPYSFGELDGDGDGKVSQAEWKAGRAQLERALKETRASILESLDRDTSGRVSRFEAAEAKPRMSSLWQQTRALGIAANDKDGDGKISETELRAVLDRCTAVMTAFGARIDTDKDHRIEREETEKALRDVIEGRRKLFTLCDRNNDGQLAQKEIDLTFDLLRAIAGK